MNAKGNRMRCSREKFPPLEKGGRPPKRMREGGRVGIIRRLPLA
jgi:hypothetical protein